VLQKIAEGVRANLEARKKTASYSDLEKRLPSCRVPHDFFEAFSGQEVHAIAEIKFASPSEGAISKEQDPVAVASSYLSRGAAALSILTEENHFHGKKEYLSAVRNRFPLAKLLMKDFMLEEYQILEGRLLGADAILLIVALLGEEDTRRLLAFSKTLGLTALVEVHDEEEFEIARRVGATLIGVNNRDLKTLDISLDTSYRLAQLAPAGAKLISESGIRTGAEIRDLRKAGYHGFLVGTTLMKSTDPGEALARLLEGAR
jgi:indole-3-glycerol phosphate synthase